MIQWEPPVSDGGTPFASISIRCETGTKIHNWILPATEISMVTEINGFEKIFKCYLAYQNSMHSSQFDVLSINLLDHRGSFPLEVFELTDFNAKCSGFHLFVKHPSTVVLLIFY
ncbi:LOW QUALITY PROTEIN: hypothetical protein HZS_5427 [Henneguya salminicola]|nr:LOW QUALITY PROTEIN: hypothetical protein HZS_5427 [Henneguya salminicola]